MCVSICLYCLYVYNHIVVKQYLSLHYVEYNLYQGAWLLNTCISHHHLYNQSEVKTCVPKHHFLACTSSITDDFHTTIYCGIIFLLREPDIRSNSIFYKVVIRWPNECSWCVCGNDIHPKIRKHHNPIKCNHPTCYIVLQAEITLSVRGSECG